MKDDQHRPKENYGEPSHCSLCAKRAFAETDKSTSFDEEAPLSVSGASRVPARIKKP